MFGGRKKENTSNILLCEPCFSVSAFVQYFYFNEMKVEWALLNGKDLFAKNIRVI